MTAALRALSALLLLAGVYVVTGLLVLLWPVWALLAVWLTGDRDASPQFNTIPLLVAAATFVPVVLAARALAGVSRPVAARTDSILLPRAQAPALWRSVEELAAQVGTAAPAEIRLVPEANAAVVDNEWLFALDVDRRRLYLGAPLLAGLRPDELRAVLAHEFGHYACRHVRFTEPAHRSYRALLTAREGIREAMVANRAIHLYAWPLLLFVAACTAVTYRLIRPVRQRQEFEADRIAARVVGPGALADGLRSTAAIDAAWRQFEQEFAEPMRQATGTVPDDAYRAFASMVHHPDYQPRLTALRRAAEEVPADGFHPSVRRRLDRLAGLPAGPTPPAAPDLSDVLPGGASRRLLPRPGRRRPWREWSTALAAQRADLTVDALRTAVHRDGRPLTLDDVLEPLAAGRADRLAAALDPDPEQGRRRLVEAVTVLVGSSLVEAGRGDWAINWTGPSRLVSVDAPTEEVAERVRRAVADPDEVPDLRRWLGVLGADPGATVISGRPTDVPRTLTVAPALDKETRRVHRRIAHVSLAVQLSLLTVAGLYWLQDESSYPPPSGTPIIWRTDPADPTGRYPLPTYPTPLPGRYPGGLPDPFPSGIADLLPTPPGIGLVPRTTR